MKTTKLFIALAVALFSTVITSCNSPEESAATTTIGDIQIVGTDSASAKRVQGLDSIMKYLEDSVRYPQEAIDRYARGCVIVQFAIDSVGKACDERVVQSVDPQLDGEVIRLVRNMPQWEPAQQPVHYTLPITFHMVGDTINKEPMSLGDISKMKPKRPYIILTFADSTTIIVSGKQLHYCNLLGNFDFLKPFGLTLENVARIDSLTSAMAESMYGEEDKDGAVVYHVKDRPLSEVTDTLSRYWYIKGSSERLRVEIKKLGETDAQVVEYRSKHDGAFIEYEMQPEFPGGTKALMDYINANKTYPQEARERGIKGRVFVMFVVEIDGSIRNELVVKPVDPQLDAEAIRLVRNMPSWEPGMMRGVPIRVRYTLPVIFRPDG